MPKCESPEATYCTLHRPTWSIYLHDIPAEWIEEVETGGPDADLLEPTVAAWHRIQAEKRAGTIYDADGGVISRGRTRAEEAFASL